MESFMVHSTTGKIITIPPEVLRRILTAAQFNLQHLPDKTGAEKKAEGYIIALQVTYPELI